MAPATPFNATEITEKARRDLLLLLEGVSSQSHNQKHGLTLVSQIRGKKNLVLEKGLAGPLNLLVKFSTLQEYGVDKPFFLENDNVDASQRNVVFLVRGEKAKTVIRVAGMWCLFCEGLMGVVLLVLRCLALHAHNIYASSNS